MARSEGEGGRAAARGQDLVEREQEGNARAEEIDEDIANNQKEDGNNSIWKVAGRVSRKLYRQRPREHRERTGDPAGTVFGLLW